MSDLAGAIANLPPGSGIRVGTVKSLNPLKIDVGGGNVEKAGTLAFLRTGDVVACMRQGQTWLVLGVVWPAQYNIGAPTVSRGTVAVTVTASATSAVTAHTGLWSAPTAPAFVLTNMIAKPGGSANWWVAGLNPTTNGFTSAAYGPANASAMNLTFGYIAIW